MKTTTGIVFFFYCLRVVSCTLYNHQGENEMRWHCVVCVIGSCVFLEAKNMLKNLKKYLRNHSRMLQELWQKKFFSMSAFAQYLRSLVERKFVIRHQNQSLFRQTEGAAPCRRMVGCSFANNAPIDLVWNRDVLQFPDKVRQTCALLPAWMSFDGCWIWSWKD